MNAKIKKLRSEREKNSEKISKLTDRNNEIDQEITDLENLDIIGLVRGVGLTPDQLAALLKGAPSQAPVSDPPDAPAESYAQEGGYGEG